MEAPAPTPLNRAQRRKIQHNKPGRPPKIHLPLPPSENQQDGAIEPPSPDTGTIDPFHGGHDSPPADRKAPVSRTKKLTDEERIKRLTSYYGMIGMPLYAYNAYDGTLVLETAESCATSLVNVAHHHKPMMKVIDLLCQGNDYMQLIFVHASIVLGIAANHKAIPYQWAAFMQAPPPPWYQPPAEQVWHTPQPQTQSNGHSPISEGELAQREAWMRAEAERIAMSQAIGAQAEYDPQDVKPHADQNPAFLGNITTRRA